ncbi:MAG: type II toxin-antitoxin system RelE/ParE family toxin [Actinomycetota bacterium]
MARSEPWAIEWARPARRALARLPEKVVAAAIEFLYGPLAEDPFRVGRPLRFELQGRHSAHRGDYRIIYQIDEARRVVYILTIDHRADVYRHT